MNQILTEQEAQLYEAARALLQISKALNPDETINGGPMLLEHHVIHCGTALAELDTGDGTLWSKYTPIVRVVAEMEGIK